MKQKLMDLLAKLKPLALKAYAASPAAVGLCIGYFGHDAIALGVRMVATVVKSVIG